VRGTTGRHRFRPAALAPPQANDADGDSVGVSEPAEPGPDGPAPGSHAACTAHQRRDDERWTGYASPVTALWEQDAITLAGMLRGREVSAREVIAAHIERIDAVDRAVNAMVTRCFEQAMAKAAAADQALARGEPPGLLHGLPVAHKDLVDTAGVRTTYGSPLFAEHVPERDDLLVSRMAGAGAISLGKTNTPEFGAGSHTVNRVFGATRNPYDLSRSAGGSSGGAAAQVVGRRQRSRRLVAQSGQLLQRGGLAAVAGPGAQVAGYRPGRHPRCPGADGPHRRGHGLAAGRPVRA